MGRIENKPSKDKGSYFSYQKILLERGDKSEKGGLM